MERSAWAFGVEQPRDQFHDFRGRTRIGDLYIAPVAFAHARRLTIQSSPRLLSNGRAPEQTRRGGVIHGTGRGQQHGVALRGGQLCKQSAHEPIQLFGRNGLRRQALPQHADDRAFFGHTVGNVPSYRIGRLAIGEKRGHTMPALRRPDLRHRVAAQPARLLFQPLPIRFLVRVVLGVVMQSAYPMLGEQPAVTNDRIG